MTTPDRVTLLICRTDCGSVGDCLGRDCDREPVEYMPVSEHEAFVRRLRGLLDDLELHDDTGEDVDIGFMAAWQEFDAAVRVAENTQGDTK